MRPKYLSFPFHLFLHIWGISTGIKGPGKRRRRDFFVGNPNGIVYRSRRRNSPSFSLFPNQVWRRPPRKVVHGGAKRFFHSGSDCLNARWRKMCASNGFFISRGEKIVAARWRLTATRDFLAFNLLTWFYSAK